MGAVLGVGRSTSNEELINNSIQYPRNYIRLSMTMHDFADPHVVKSFSIDVADVAFSPPS
jgi:hypothetical protein